MVLTNHLSVFMLATGYIWISVFRMFMVCIVLNKCNVGFFCSSLAEIMFHSEVFAIAVYPAAGNSFLMCTQTQFNVSKMYLPFHFEWHLKNPHIFRMLGFICQYCRMDWSRWQNCESSQVSWGYVESSGGMAQTDTQNYSELLPWRRSGNFFFVSTQFTAHIQSYLTFT